MQKNPTKNLLFCSWKNTLRSFQKVEYDKCAHKRTHKIHLPLRPTCNLPLRLVTGRWSLSLSVLPRKPSLCLQLGIHSPACPSKPEVWERVREKERERKSFPSKTLTDLFNLKEHLGGLSIRVLCRTLGKSEGPQSLEAVCLVASQRLGWITTHRWR